MCQLLPAKPPLTPAQEQRILGPCSCTETDIFINRLSGPGAEWQLPFLVSLTHDVNMLPLEIQILERYGAQLTDPEARIQEKEYDCPVPGCEGEGELHRSSYNSIELVGLAVLDGSKQGSDLLLSKWIHNLLLWLGCLDPVDDILFAELL